MENAESTPMSGSVFMDLSSIKFKYAISFINVIIADEADDNKIIRRIKIFNPYRDNEVSKLMDSAKLVGTRLEYYSSRSDINRLIKNELAIKSKLPAIQEMVKYIENNQLLGSIHTFCANKDYSAVFAECSFKFNRRGLSEFDRLTELLDAAVHIDHGK